MQKTENKAHAETGKHAPMTPEQKKERKDRVLTHGTPSIVGSIADAVVIKSEDPFFLTKPDGSVPMTEGHGYGLYYHDCRYLNGYELKIAGKSGNMLVSTGDKGYMSVYELTNPDIRMKDNRLIKKEQIGIEWVRMLDGKKLELNDLITFRNFSLEECAFPVTFEFRAEFEDVFAIRGLLQEKLGTTRPPQWKDGSLALVYDGTDGLTRSVTVSFSESPEQTHDTTAQFQVKIAPRGTTTLMVTLALAETRQSQDPQGRHAPRQYDADLKAIENALHEKTNHWLQGQTDFHSDSMLLDGIVQRSLLDLHMLMSKLHDYRYYAAGLPWFGTLFGRDSATACLQTLAFQPDIAAETLRLLAYYQGDKVDEYRDEQPGKILHSVRVGEMARTGEIPHAPYYGTVDSTPLFLILMGQYTAWTGDLQLFKDLQDNVNRALEWMGKYGDTDGDGYIDYCSTSESGLINQGWKDSGDAIVDESGKLAVPPIALVEVQGYAYMAKKGIADLFERCGQKDRAEQLRKEADDLRTRFNKDFWMEGKGIYCMALEKGGKPCAVVSSNPGQAMWTGITDDDKAIGTGKRLMKPDMYNGWGVRTLSSDEKRYNPIAYHLGTVWPHDNSIIAAGFRRYGLDNEAAQVCTGIVEAAMHFPNYRLPELFAGFGKEDYGTPVHYPVACHPQAWAAGSVPFIMTTLLGLVPRAFDNCLRVERPILPDFVYRIELRGMRVGKGTADLLFERKDKNRVEAQVLGTSGGLRVEIEAES